VVIPAIIPAAAAIVVGYFSYSAGVNAVLIPLRATQTAEARQTPALPTAQTSLTLSTQQVSTPTAQVVTVTQVIQVTPTADMNTMPIESLPLYVVAYGDSDNLDTANRGSARLTVSYDAEAGIDYIVDYSLPDSGEGNAGIAFKFFEPYDVRGYDLAGYKFIEVAISFGDEQAGCELFIKDVSDKTDAVLLNNNVVNLSQQNGAIRLTLSDDFDAVNLKVIKEIGCNAKTAFSQGKHVFTITGIRFIKE
jgi:hypothetical protein